MTEVIALGELLIDFAQKGVEGGYPLLQAQPGGAPANYLAAVNKYGHSAGMTAKVGNDAFGNLLVATLDSAGIDTKNVVLSEDYFTTLAFVTLDGSGDRSFSFARKPGADTQIDFDEIDLSEIDGCKVFHYGTLSMTDEKCRETTLKCIDYAKSRGKIISCDPNLRLVLWDSPEKAKEAMKTALSKADVVKISDEEVEFLFGCDEKQGAEILHRDYGVKVCYVTLGAKGCYYSANGFTGYVDGVEVDVLDTTGAGDIFGGSAMAMLLDTGKEPGELTERDLRNIVTFAVNAASLSTQKHGGIMSVPEKSEVLAKIGK